MRCHMLGTFLVCALFLWILPTAWGSQPDQLGTPSLMLNDHYVREGAVTNFDTCLAVADDHRAYEVWRSADPQISEVRSVSEKMLAGKLDGLHHQIKHRLGFGTIYACARIIEAWHGMHRPFSFKERFQTYPGPEDGRFQHGTVVVDLKANKMDDHGDPIGSIVRGSIEAVPLVRILTSPLLLPPRAFGGIVIRNAEINGTLLFHNVHLSIPLSFANVKFRGHSYQKNVFGDKVEEPVKDTAIAIINSRLKDRLQISDSQLCGGVRMIDSQFAETVKFMDVQQVTITCRPIMVSETSDDSTSQPAGIRISSSTFNQSFSTILSNIINLHISSSDIRNLVSSRTNFGQLLKIWESDIGSMLITCSTLAKTVSISYNHVDKDLYVLGSRSQQVTGGTPCNEWWDMNEPPAERATIVISSNRIGGGLGLKQLNGSITGSKINLASNRVGNGSEIYVPSPDKDGKPWHGRINLEGSIYEGRIVIGRDSAGSDQVVGNVHEKDQIELSDIIVRYCSPLKNSRSAAVIQFRAARIRTLEWDLPITCKYRWKGYGLTYDLWLAGDTAKASTVAGLKIESHEALRIWRRSLADYESASLDAMSSYLAGKGSYVDSRNILLEAKRLSYAPECRPDHWAWRCIDYPFVGKPSGSNSLSNSAMASETSHASNEGSGQNSPSFGERFQSAAMLILLAPGGYGAQPERSLIMIGATSIIFFGIYFCYSRWLLWKLRDVPICADDLMLTISTQSKQLLLPGSPRNELQETQELAFEHKMDKPDIEDWPTVDQWSSYSTDERLERVQDLLVKKVRPCQDEASGMRLRELKKLCKRLERFGNTETAGFSLFDQGKMPTRFTHWRYSIDTMLPVIDLHAYGIYYPVSGWVRFISVLQHVLGWWWLTVFIASAAIL